METTADPKASPPQKTPVATRETTSTATTWDTWLQTEGTAFPILPALSLMEEWEEEASSSLNEQINHWALELKQAVGKEQRPEFIINHCNEWFFGSQHLTIDPAYTTAPLRKTVEKKSAPVEGLAALYWVLATLAGWPISPVLAGDHLFLRFEGGGFSRNIELELKGRARLDSSYQELYQLPADQVKRGWFLKTLSSREAIGYYHYYHGRHFMKSGELARATSRLQLAARCYPDFFPALQLLADYHLSRQDPRAALPLLDRTLSTIPDWLPAVRTRAQAHAQLGNYDSALSDYRTLAAHRGKDPAPLRWLAHGLTQAQRAEEALEAWKEFSRAEGVSDPERLEAQEEMRRLRVTRFRKQLTLSAAPYPSRFEAVRELEKLKAEEAIPDLISQLEDPNHKYHWFVAAALTTLTGQEMEGTRQAWQRWWEEVGSRKRQK